MELNIHSNATLKLTQKAREKVIQAASQHMKENSLKELPAVRVAVKPGGCSGFMYEMFFETNFDTDDEVLEFEDARVVVDPESKEMLKGSTLDYEETLTASGFKFSNPNATRTCGCGNSFG